ncbi:MAG: response regulator [Candidatus Omnitrophica bacterium]|nr:response regulator [Candidatus Omnitrophota bacterium]
MAKIRILLIDDEVHLCRMIKLNLERDGRYEIVTAFSGEEGVDKAKAEPFDLVITDFRMPGMNGKEVLEALKAFNPKLPVILSSVYHDDPTVITQATDRQADGLVSKPIDHAKLEAVIQEVLSRARGAQ